MLFRIGGPDAPYSSPRDPKWPVRRSPPFPAARGPADITPALAKLFKTKRMEAGLSAYTVRGNINQLSCIWGKWWDEACGLLSENPWLEVEKPKVDEREKRYIVPEEERAFFAYMLERWQDWRLPVLFYSVKGLIGCRILQLCAARTADLRGGRLVLVSESAKGRKVRNPRLPESLYQELQALAGPTWLWEKFPEQLNALFQARRMAKSCLPDFCPKRFKWWLQDEMTRYNKANKGKPDFRPFTSHNFRGTAMSTAVRNGATVDEAAIAFGCNPSTIKAHYLSIEEEEVADTTLDRVFQARGQGRHEPGPEQRPTALPVACASGTNKQEVR